MRIALVQQKATEDKQANVERGLRAIDEAAAAGAKLICCTSRLRGNPSSATSTDA